MPTWPASLPQQPDAPGYKESPQSQVIRTDMDAGPKKSRRRFTAGSRSIPVTYSLLTRARVQVFEDFFDDDIAAGALAFNWPQPRTGKTVSVQIVGDPPYSLEPKGPGKFWTLKFTLEIQP